MRKRVKVRLPIVGGQKAAERDAEKLSRVWTETGFGNLQNMLFFTCWTSGFFAFKTILFNCIYLA